MVIPPSRARSAAAGSGRLALALLAATGLASCVVGPNYAGPPHVAPQAQRASAFHRAEDASAAVPASAWWLALQDAELDRLISAALAGSPDLEVARARILQSRANLSAARADRLPSLQATGLYLRTAGADSLLTGGGTAAAAAAPGAAASTDGGDTFEFGNIGASATWEPDFFGGRRRAVEGAYARSQADRNDFEAAKVSLAAEVASAYVMLRDAQTRLELSRQDAGMRRQMAEIAADRRRGGTATDLDVARLNEQLQSALANSALLQAGIDEQMDRLALLTGQEAGALDAVLAPPAAPPSPPASVTVGDPARLLRQRPDIRAAERRIAAANALIGQRTADLFPKVTLLGNLGFGSTDISNLISSDSFTYAVAPFLQWKPFDFGRTRASIENARGQTAEAMADYRRTVLGALQDAETSLSRYARQRERVRDLLQVQAAADHLARLTTLRVAGGTAAPSDLLEAQSQKLSAEIALATAQAQLTLDFVGLQKSLGLGWDTAALSPGARR